MQNIITINGVEYPQPSYGLNFAVATIVDSARNADGVVVGQRVGRDQQKIDSLQWNYLTAAQWSSLLKAFENFYITVTYPDMVNNTWTTRQMYVGDRTATPLFVGEDGLPTAYINCKANLIDTGAAIT